MTAEGKKATSGQVPKGYLRLSANVREDLHMRLKIMSAKERRTIGSVLEEWIEKNTPEVWLGSSF